MVVGPVEYIIVGFPGNKFNGKVAPELAKLIDGGLIRILDLTVITKDESGEVASFELTSSTSWRRSPTSKVRLAAS